MSGRPPGVRGFEGTRSASGLSGGRCIAHIPSRCRRDFLWEHLPCLQHKDKKDGRDVSGEFCFDALLPFLRILLATEGAVAAEPRLLLCSLRPLNSLPRLLWLLALGSRLMAHRLLSLGWPLLLILLLPLLP